MLVRASSEPFQSHALRHGYHCHSAEAPCTAAMQLPRGVDSSAPRGQRLIVCRKRAGIVGGRYSTIRDNGQVHFQIGKKEIKVDDNI